MRNAPSSGTRTTTGELEAGRGGAGGGGGLRYVGRGRAPAMSPAVRRGRGIATGRRVAAGAQAGQLPSPSVSYPMPHLHRRARSCGRVVGGLRRVRRAMRTAHSAARMRTAAAVRPALSIQCMVDLRYCQ